MTLTEDQGCPLFASALTWPRDKQRDLDDTDDYIDTKDTSRHKQIQTDTNRYKQTQTDTNKYKQDRLAADRADNNCGGRHNKTRSFFIGGNDIAISDWHMRMLLRDVSISIVDRGKRERPLAAISVNNSRPSSRSRRQNKPMTLNDRRWRNQQL